MYDYDFIELDTNNVRIGEVKQIASSYMLRAGDRIVFDVQEFEVVRVCYYFGASPGALSGQHKERDVPDLLARAIDTV